MIDKEYTKIQVTKETARKIKQLRITPNETYDNIILRLMKEAHEAHENKKEPWLNDIKMIIKNGNEGTGVSGTGTGSVEFPRLDWES